MNAPWPASYKVDAFISENGVYRYWLDIKWDETLPMMAAVLWNPSKADHRISDPTAIRVVGFAKREKFGGVRIVNLFAFRATDPKELKTAVDPVGPSNFPTWLDTIERTSKIVVGWGAGVGSCTALDQFLFYTKGKPLFCLGVSKTGAPRHPLYLRSDSPMIPWSPR